MFNFQFKKFRKSNKEEQIKWEIYEIHWANRNDWEKKQI